LLLLGTLVPGARSGLEPARKLEFVPVQPLRYRSLGSFAGFLPLGECEFVAASTSCAEVPVVMARVHYWVAFGSNDNG
jgi:hypothetical protein